MEILKLKFEQSREAITFIKDENFTLYTGFRTTTINKITTIMSYYWYTLEAENFRFSVSLDPHQAITHVHDNYVIIHLQRQALEKFCRFIEDIAL